MLSVINNHLGKLSNKQNMLILRLIMNSNFEKSNLKNIANEFSKEFSIANKKSNKIVRDIYSSVFKKSF